MKIIKSDYCLKQVEDLSKKYHTREEISIFLQKSNNKKIDEFLKIQSI